MTVSQSTQTIAPRRPRLRLLALLQGLVIVGSLLAPLSAFAAITSVTIGAQAPNPVTAGNDATYTVTVVRTTTKAVRDHRQWRVSRAERHSSRHAIDTTSSASLTLTIHTTVATPAGSSTITPTVEESTAGELQWRGRPK